MSFQLRNPLCQILGAGILSIGLAWLAYSARHRLAQLSRADISTTIDDPASLKALEPKVARMLPVAMSLPSAHPLDLTAVANPALTEEIELSQLAAAENLELTSGQLKTLAAVTATFQETRHSYEASIAHLMVKNGSALQLVVPMYSEFGDSLRALYYQELNRDLGPTLTTQIQQKIGAELEVRFADFGNDEQKLEVAVEEKSSGVEYVVNSTSVYYPEGSPTNAFAVRKETHLLPFEDPSGTEWGAFTRLFASGRQT